MEGKKSEEKEEEKRERIYTIYPIPPRAAVSRMARTSWLPRLCCRMCSLHRSASQILLWKTDQCRELSFQNHWASARGCTRARDLGKYYLPSNSLAVVTTTQLHS